MFTYIDDLSGINEDTLKLCFTLDHTLVTKENTQFNTYLKFVCENVSDVNVLQYYKTISACEIGIFQDTNDPYTYVVCMSDSMLIKENYRLTSRFHTTKDLTNKGNIRAINSTFFEKSYHLYTDTLSEYLSQCISVLIKKLKMLIDNEISSDYPFLVHKYKKSLSILNIINNIPTLVYIEDSNTQYTLNFKVLVNLVEFTFKKSKLTAYQKYLELCKLFVRNDTLYRYNPIYNNLVEYIKIMSNL